MELNVNLDNRDWNFEIANRYLPVRLSTMNLGSYGECIVITVNRGDTQYTDIIEGDKSEYFVTSFDPTLYEDVKQKMIKMDFWKPNTHYNTYNGTINGESKKIHMDGMIF